MAYHFFAMLSRMKYIQRWSLMRNTRPESVCEHAYDVTVLAHVLALLHNRRFGGSADVGLTVLMAAYHDAPEIFTGDLPTPVKYHNPEIAAAYRQVESVMSAQLLSMLPADLREDFTPLLCPDRQFAEEKQLVKAADKLAALIKCIEERKQGNREFASAEKSLRGLLADMELPAVTCFIEEFLPGYSLTIDEMN